MSKYTPTERIDVYNTMIRYLRERAYGGGYLCDALANTVNFDKAQLRYALMLDELTVFRFMRDNLPELWSIRPQTAPGMKGLLWLGTWSSIEGDLVLHLWYETASAIPRIALLEQAIKLVVV